MKYHLISLGCAKNLVDSELVLGGCDERGWVFVQNPEDANVLLLNTCGFIQPAVEEAVDEILALAELKKNDPDKRVIVFGCLVQRYREQLVDLLPEVDLFVGTEAIIQIPALIEKLFTGSDCNKVHLENEYLMTARNPRMQTTPFFRAWMKITEGCDNHCSYCMIPSIRGRLRSRSIEDLVEEAIILEKNGVRELSLIAQDLTAYGDDLDGEVNLVVLLREILAKTEIPWLRLLYLYPSGVTNELLELIAEEKRIVKYLDIPFQHVNDRLLKAMNRPYGRKDLEMFVEKIRDIIPNIALRTTFLVGFPGETEAEFEEIVEFLNKYRLDHVGVFPYSKEEGSVAENFSGQLDEDEKNRRCSLLLERQQEISAQILQKYVGTIQKVLVEGVSRETDLLLEGRTRYQAPDIDGCVYINEGHVQAGDIAEVYISEAQQYDLIGGVIESDTQR